MWNELMRTSGSAYHAGTSGTVTIPKGAVVIRIIAHSASTGSLTIFGGDSIPVLTSGLNIAFQHQLWRSFNNSTTSGSQDLVFTTTDMYFVEYLP